MRRKIVKNLCLFVFLSFIIFVYIVLLEHFVPGKNHSNPKTWEEIYDNIFSYIGISIFFGTIAFIIKYLNNWK